MPSMHTTMVHFLTTGVKEREKLYLRHMTTLWPPQELTKGMAHAAGSLHTPKYSCYICICGAHEEADIRLSLQLMVVCVCLKCC